MINQRFLVSVFCIIMAQLTLAEGDAMPEYAVVSAWSIRIDTSTNNGCFAFAKYEEGSVIRVGIDNRDDSVYAVFGNYKWESIEYGKKYDVEIQFGNESKWNGNAKGMSFEPPENQPFLWIKIADEDSIVSFIKEFMSEEWVELFYNGNSISKLVLEDSYAAGLKIIECQKDMRPNATDPFAQPGGSSDPFST